MEPARTHRDSDRQPKGALYVVATPIGNLRDITLRALEVLKSVPVIAAEDTRVAARLLAHHGISAKVISVHGHNERRAAARVLALLAEGKSVALVADAGTPAVSDPGAQLVAAVRAAGYAVSPVPGASAVIAALSAAGVTAARFLFYGFLPQRKAERRRALEALRGMPYLTVFYEAPHRVAETVSDMGDVLGGDRRIVIARELTKIFESIHATTLAGAEEWLAADPDRSRGEFVLLVEGAQSSDAAEAAQAGRLLSALLRALPLRQAVAVAAEATGARRNELYAMALRIRGSRSRMAGPAANDEEPK